MILAVLVDEEPLALQLLTRKLKEFKDVKVVKSFTNPQALIESMRDLSFNVAFLDITMPRMDGIDLANQLLSNDPTIKIVFVTAYRDYAIEAFELNSIDYILKPLTNERLQVTVERLRRAISTESRPQPESNQQLEIQCFLEFSVQYKQQPVKWKTAKVKELFAIFMTYHKESIHRDTLIDVLWHDVEYEKAKIQLHTALSHLRKTLATLGYPKAIVFTNQSYRLELSNFYCSAGEMERLVKQYDTVTDTVIPLFEKSIQTYQGDFMELEGYHWTHIRAEDMRQQAITMLNRMYDYYYNKKDTANIQLTLERLLKRDPYSEQVLQQLMTHYQQQGKRIEAIKTYHSFSEKLNEELGISPSQLTDNLFTEVLNGDI